MIKNVCVTILILVSCSFAFATPDKASTQAGVTLDSSNESPGLCNECNVNASQAALRLGPTFSHLLPSSAENNSSTAVKPTSGADTKGP